MDEGRRSVGLFLFRMLLTIIVIMLLVNTCSYFNGRVGLKNDNVIEANIEDMIESHLGISIDLTPSDPDDDDYTLDMWRKN